MRRHRTSHLLVLVVLLVTLGVASFPRVAYGATSVTATYAADSSIFANPERGFYSRYDIMSDRDFSRARNAGNTLVHSYVRLDSYRSTSIPQSFLDQLQDGLNALRSQGMKAILRFAYNFGPYPDSEPDATEYWIGQHLQQVEPVLTANADVIASFEAGFIGAWGEWHTSTNGLDTDMAAKTRIADDILSHIPSSRQAALRYPSDLRAIDRSRLGSHQDCFLASDPDDWGTWGRDGHTPQQDKELIASIGVSRVVGGETCNADVAASRANCTTALAELAWMHWSYLNEDYEQNTLQMFRDQGCFDDIKRYLGYRFRLIDATYNNTINAGETFNLQIRLHNDGYASPYNQRPVFAVLDGNGQTYTFSISVDPRTWE